MLSLEELRRAAGAIESIFCGHRVEKLVQPDGVRVAMVLYGRVREDEEAGRGGERSGRRTLLLCCHPELGHVGLLPKAPPGPKPPAELPAFAKLARPRLGGARLKSARVLEHDRVLRLLFATPAASGERGAEDVHELALCLTGRRANLFLLGAEERVLGALRPFAKTRPELRPGATWTDPPPREASSSSAGRDRFEAHAAETQEEALELLAAIALDYGDAQEERSGEELARRLGAALRKERKQADKRLARVQEELAEADQAAVLQRHGELLKSALATIEPGQSEVVVEDWESGEPVAIPLDPRKNAKQNLEATFKRYQKLIRRLAKAGGQLDEAQQRVDQLAALAAEVEEAADDGATLDAIAKRGEVAPLLERHASKPVDAPRPPKPKGPFADLPGKLRPRRYLSSDGLEIWVGRSDEGNDHLSTRLARGKDLFFHVEASPGSHVVLRTEGRDDPPSESVLEAAELAVRFSKQKNAGRCDVHVVPIKNVKKPKGAKPGLVMVTGGRSLHLRRDEDRLARVLAAQIVEPDARAGARR